VCAWVIAALTRVAPAWPPAVRGMVLIQMFSPLPHHPPHSCPLALARPGHCRVPLMKICRQGGGGMSRA